MQLPGFVGPFAESRSRTFNTEDTINWYLEQRDTGTPRSQWAFYPTPGCRVFASFDLGTGRGLFAQDGRAFGVSGTQFGELTSAGALINGNTVADDSLPATFASNGSVGEQLLVTAGGLGYIFALDAATFVQITDPDFPPDVGMSAYMDTYFLVLVRNSRQFNISAQGDGLSWDGLDIYLRSEGSDNLVAMVQNHREVWFLGSKTSEVWIDTGDASTPFQPIPGVFIQQGCLAAYSALRLDNSVAWLGQDEKGQGPIVYLANGYTPQRISTYPVEEYLSQSAVLDEAIAFSFQLKGHLWYGLYVSDLLETLVYDVSTGQWFKWAHWQPNTPAYMPHVCVSACAAFGDVLIADRQSRAVYRLDFEAFDDALVV